MTQIVSLTTLYRWLRTFLVLTFVYVYIAPAHAAVTPVSLAIAPPVQFPSDEYSITGVRLSVLWGHHRDIYGIDLGVLGNMTDQDFYGIGVSGIFNKTTGTTFITGLQLAGITNINTNKTRVVGIQAALGANVNTASSSVAGLQVSLANLSSHTDIYGFQVGLYNDAQAVYGFQIGLVNKTANLHGVQIGLINFNASGIFKVAPILNIGF